MGTWVKWLKSRNQEVWFINGGQGCCGPTPRPLSFTSFNSRSDIEMLGRESEAIEVLLRGLLIVKPSLIAYLWILRIYNDNHTFSAGKVLNLNILLSPDEWGYKLILDMKRLRAMLTVLLLISKSAANNPEKPITGTVWHRQRVWSHISKGKVLELEAGKRVRWYIFFWPGAHVYTIIMI